MRLSYDWLSDYVDLSGLSPQEVADRLTMGAFEVEEVSRVGPDVEGPLVVGEIVAINPHPNADKIRLTRVKVDQSSEPLEIVCGANNIIVGQRIPVALPGARVINRHDGTPLAIKQSKIRGVVSNGMLCSPPELGITAAEEDGILILYGKPEIGADAKKLLHLYPDAVLHVEPRSNRGDALSVIGMAREVAALFGRPLTEPVWALPDPDRTSESVKIYIEDHQDCPYFSMRILQGLMVRPSSLWMTRRLEAIGVRPVNNIVDVTNYVLHELGQPLHAYDLSKLEGPVVETRRGRKGEKLVTLDGRERQLNEEILTIADSKKPIGVAGVMGGKDSEVTDETTFVALEAAAFHPARVRRAGRLLGLSSDSSLRFERGVDIAAVHRASDRAAYLMLESAGGFLGMFTSGGSDLVAPVHVNLRLGQLKRLLEIEPLASQVESLLTPLGFHGKQLDEETLQFSVPTFRQRDVKREIDLLEEVCRLWGYDKIPASMPASTMAPQPADTTEPLTKEAMRACGLNEAYTSSLTGRNSSAETDDSIAVLNPLSPEHQVLRSDLLPGLVAAVAYNLDRGHKDVWLFETGRTYKRSGSGNDRNPGVKEELKVAGAICGSRALSRWQTGAAEADFYSIKGVVENLLSQLSIDTGRAVFSANQNPPGFFHPGRSCSVELEVDNGKQLLGWLGQIHPALADESGLKHEVFLFELSLDAIGTHRRQHRFVDIFNTPSVVRDLTADVVASTDQQALQNCISRAAGPYLRRLELVSVFNLGDGRQSLSYRLTFQHPEETLTNQQVEETLANIRQQAQSQLDASFRL